MDFSSNFKQRQRLNESLTREIPSPIRGGLAHPINEFTEKQVPRTIRKSKKKKKKAVRQSPIGQGHRIDYYASIPSVVKSHVANFMLFVAEEEQRIEE